MIMAIFWHDKVACLLKGGHQMPGPRLSNQRNSNQQSFIRCLLCAEKNIQLYTPLWPYKLLKTTVHLNPLVSVLYYVLIILKIILNWEENKGDVLRSSSPRIYSLVGKQTLALKINKIKQKLFNMKQIICNIYKENAMRILWEKLSSSFQHSKDADLTHVYQCASSVY